MAITCKICHKELDVFSGGRCRKCRQLVCGDCTATGGASSSEGLLCRECAQAEAVLDGASAPAAGADAAAPQAAGPRWRPPLWLWIAGPLFAALAAAAFVGLPWLNAWRHLRTLRQGDDKAAAAAAAALGEAGTPEIAQALKEIVVKEGEPARARAVRALGMMPTAPARAFLRELQGSADTPAPLRSLIVEALREQERRGWRDEATAGGGL